MAEIYRVVKRDWNENVIYESIRCWVSLVLICSRLSGAIYSQSNFTLFYAIFARNLAAISITYFDDKFNFRMKFTR